MPALILLATLDDRLAAAWERQIPRGWPSARLGSDHWPASLAPGAPGLLVLDVAAKDRVSRGFLQLPAIWIGEKAPQAGDAPTAHLSPEESLHRLAEVLRLVDQIAEQRAMIDLLVEKCRRPEPFPAAPRHLSDPSEAGVVWELFEGAWEQLEQREPLLAEFRRAARALFHTAEARFFLADGALFRAEPGPGIVRADDPLVRRFERHPYPLDAEYWDPAADPAEEAGARGRLAQWGIRLAAPLNDRGRLQGWIALGPRRDGKRYDEGDRARLAQLARLLGRGLREPAPKGETADEGALLREIGLTLAHELGNALVSLSALRQWEAEAPPAPVLDAAKHEIGELEQLHREIGRLQELDAYPIESIDLRDVIRQIGAELNRPVELGDEPVELLVAIPLIRFALRTLAHAAQAAVIQLRAVAGPGGPLALISARGTEMELSGLLPDLQRPGVPNQGRLAVFLAKEIIRLHGGEIRRGPGPAGSELLIALRSRG